MRRPAFLASTLILLAVLLVPAGAGAAPQLGHVVDLSGTPGQLVRGSDGNMWVTISGSSNGSTLARIKPTGKVKEFAPAQLVNPVGITSGPDKNLWLTRNGGVVKVPPGDPNAADDTNIGAITDPRGITKGPQGRLWTASGDKLVSFDPANPAGASSTTISGMGARGIAASGGKLWIADFGGQRIVRSTPAGDTKNYNVGGGPQEVASGPKGSIAFANPGSDPQTVGRISPPAKPKKTRVPGSDPFGMVFAPDRHWWFAEFAKHRLGILSTNGNVTHFKKLPNNSGPRYVARGGKGSLWVSLENSEKVAQVKRVR
jgi:virginiamycin B lyase